jgi:hypothetical protein
VQKTLDRILETNGLGYKQRGKIFAIFPTNESGKNIWQFKQKVTAIPASGLNQAGNLPTNQLPASLTTATSQNQVDITITGIVKSETGEDLPGVRVVSQELGQPGNDGAAITIRVIGSYGAGAGR